MFLLNVTSQDAITGGQIAIIVIVSVLLLSTLVLGIYIAFLFRKKNKKMDFNPDRMQTEELQTKYNDLIERLNALKNGISVAELSPLDIDEQALLTKLKAEALKKKKKDK